MSIIARNYFNIPFEDRKKIKVLDLGCGGGNNAKYFAENGFNYYGIDGSSSAIKVCKNRFKKWNLKGNFVQGDFLELPYEDNCFDLIVDRESTYANKLKDLNKIIEQIHKKLKKNGLYLSFTYSSQHQSKEFGEILEPNTYYKFNDKSCFHKTGIVHFIDIKEIIKVYSKFKIQNIMRHSLYEIYNQSSKLMEYDEYIIIARR